MTVDVSPKPESQEVYLGDGCYARFDGFSVILRAPRAEGDHIIYLEPSVFDALIYHFHVVR